MSDVSTAARIPSQEPAASASSLAVETKQLEIYLAEGFAHVRPPCPELATLRILGCSAVDDSRHGVKLKRLGCALVEFNQPDYQLFPAGMFHALRRHASKLGYRVTEPQIGPRPYRVPTPDAPVVPLEPSYSSWYLKELAQHYGGKILYRRGTDDLVRILAAAAMAFPNERIAIVADDKEQCRTLGRQILRYCPEAVLRSADRSAGPDDRVVVTTFYGLSREMEKFRFVIVMDHRHALSHRARTALRQAWHAGIFVCVDRSATLVPSVRLRLEAIFGFTEIDLPGAGRRRRIVRTGWLRMEHGYGRVTPNGSLERKKLALWHNRGRNQALAKLVKSSSPSAAVPTGGVSRPAGSYKRCLVLIEGIEHAVELARRLPDWPIRTGAASTAALPSEIQRILEERRAIPVGDRLLVTFTALRDLDLADWDILVRADGGIGVGPLDELTLTVDEPGRPLLLVDFHDRFDPVLKRNSRSRRRAYEERGWVAVGEDPYEARIDRFLAATLPRHS